MDIKIRSFIQLSGIINEREYSFLVPFGSPYEEAKEVAKEFCLGLDELKVQNEKRAAELAAEAKVESAPIDVESEPKGE